MQPTDNFSWRRVWMLFRLYLPSLRKHLWAFPLVSFLLSAFYISAIVIDQDFVSKASTITFGITIMYYFAPIALARRDYRPISDQLPVKTSEKITMLAIYFIFFTFALTFGVEMIVCFLAGKMFPQFCSAMTEVYTMAATIYPHNSLWYLSYINAIAFPSLTIMGIVLAKRSRMWIGILSSLGGYIGLIIISAIMALITALVKFNNSGLDPAGISSEDIIAITSDVIGVILWVASGLCLAAIVTSWTIIYKKMKRGGF